MGRGQYNISVICVSEIYYGKDRAGESAYNSTTYNLTEIFTDISLRKIDFATLLQNIPPFYYDVLLLIFDFITSR